MKKQILFLVFLVLAAFANVNKSYAQCVDDALRPMAGKPYHYIISTTNGGTSPTYEWIVTTVNPIVAGGALASTIVQGPTTYTMTGGNTADAIITWSPTVIAAAMAATPTPYYVVIKYSGTNSEGCVVDNVKAYMIRPVNAFQIDLANVKADASTLASGNVCTSTIVSATITGAGVDVVYDYGTSSMYVKVTARNFSTSWNMTVDATLLANLGASETGALTWGATIATANSAITLGTAVTIPETTALSTDDESIYLKLTVDHNTFEGLTGQAFVFTVNGVDAAGNPDLSSTCVAEADVVTQNMLPRPTLIDGTDVGTFIPNNP